MPRRFAVSTKKLLLLKLLKNVSWLELHGGRVSQSSSGKGLSNYPVVVHKWLHAFKILRKVYMAAPYLLVVSETPYKSGNNKRENCISRGARFAKLAFVRYLYSSYTFRRPSVVSNNAVAFTFHVRTPKLQYCAYHTLHIYLKFIIKHLH